MTNRKDHFPLKHVVLVDKQEVWVVCNSSITAMGVPALMDRFYPGYTACLCSEKYLEKYLMNPHAN